MKKLMLALALLGVIGGQAMAYVPFISDATGDTGQFVRCEACGNLADECTCDSNVW